ncbi:MAG: hypothetical protein IKA83_04190 [Paludibacteraceae bacterium]|nr:hypothetical protein [Paludibacteraceae bacterium]MBR6685900.1 hypothetical protein [Paludibacteraceae bacterium]
MPNRISYIKPYKSAKDLVQLLQTRGLIINDLNRAENYIRHYIFNHFVTIFGNF